MLVARVLSSSRDLEVLGWRSGLEQAPVDPRELFADLLGPAGRSS